MVEPVEEVSVVEASVVVAPVAGSFDVAEAVDEAPVEKALVEEELADSFAAAAAAAADSSDPVPDTAKAYAELPGYICHSNRAVDAVVDADDAVEASPENCREPWAFTRKTIQWSTLCTSLAGSPSHIYV
jgi:hypothetical protein